MDQAGRLTRMRKGAAAGAGTSDPFVRFEASLVLFCLFVLFVCLFVCFLIYRACPSGPRHAHTGDDRCKKQTCVLSSPRFEVMGARDGDAAAERSREKQRSKVVKQSVRPRWEQRFAFGVAHARAAVRCRVFDYDEASGADFMGRFDLPLGNLGDRRARRAWFVLGDEKTGRVDRPRGEVCVCSDRARNSSALAGRGAQTAAVGASRSRPRARSRGYRALARLRAMI